MTPCLKSKETEYMDHTESSDSIMANPSFISFLENLTNNTSIIDICWLHIYVKMDSKEKIAEKNIPQC